MDLTVIVVNYNTSHLLVPVFDSLRQAADGWRIQVILIDNASRDDSVAVMRQKFADFELIDNPVNVGFGRANNQALPLALGRYVLLLNTDAFVSPDTLTKTLNYMEAHPKCGVLGVRLTGRDGALQPSCRYFPTPINTLIGALRLTKLFPEVQMVDEMDWNHQSNRSCDWVPGCYYLSRREVIDAVGLFDPRYFLYFEEVDHCKAVKKAGWEVVYFADTTVVHTGGESAKSEGPLTSSGRQISELQIESEILYFRKHHGIGGLVLMLAMRTFEQCTYAAKDIIKHKGLAVAHSKLLQACKYWVLLRRTAFGMNPIH